MTPPQGQFQHFQTDRALELSQLTMPISVEWIAVAGAFTTIVGCVLSGGFSFLARTCGVYFPCLNQEKVEEQAPPETQTQEWGSSEAAKLERRQTSNGVSAAKTGDDSDKGLASKSEDDSEKLEWFPPLQQEDDSEKLERFPPLQLDEEAYDVALNHNINICDDLELYRDSVPEIKMDFVRNSFSSRLSKVDGSNSRTMAALNYLRATDVKQGDLHTREFVRHSCSPSVSSRNSKSASEEAKKDCEGVSQTHSEDRSKSSPKYPHPPVDRATSFSAGAAGPGGVFTAYTGRNIVDKIAPELDEVVACHSSPRTVLVQAEDLNDGESTIPASPHSVQVEPNSPQESECKSRLVSDVSTSLSPACTMSPSLTVSQSSSLPRGGVSRRGSTCSNGSNKDHGPSRGGVSRNGSTSSSCSNKENGPALRDGVSRHGSDGSGCSNRRSDKDLGKEGGSNDNKDEAAADKNDDNQKDKNGGDQDNNNKSNNNNDDDEIVINNMEKKERDTDKDEDKKKEETLPTLAFAQTMMGENFPTLSDLPSCEELPSPRGPIHIFRPVVLKPRNTRFPWISHHLGLMGKAKRTVAAPDPIRVAKIETSPRGSSEDHHIICIPSLTSVPSPRDLPTPTESTIPGFAAVPSPRGMPSPGGSMSALSVSATPIQEGKFFAAVPSPRGNLDDSTSTPSLPMRVHSDDSNSTPSLPTVPGFAASPYAASPLP
eukprot:g19896.t1